MFCDFVTKHTDIFCFCFALQKLLTFFQQKYWRILDISNRNFNETLTNDIVSFEQPGPERDTLSKEKVCFAGSKFFSCSAGPIDKVGKKGNGSVIAHA